MSLAVHTCTTQGKNCALVSQLSWAVAVTADLATPANAVASDSAPLQAPSHQVSAATRLPWRRHHQRQGQTSGKLRPTRQTIRRIAALQSATHYVLFDAPEAVFAGMYLPSKVIKPPRGQLHSTALVFLRMLAAQQPDGNATKLSGVLLLQGHFSLQQVVYVVIEDGHIVIDAVSDALRAIERIEETLQIEPATPLFHNLQHNFVGWQVHTLDWSNLHPYIHADNRIERVPASPWLLISLGLALTGAGGLWAYDELIVQPQRQLQLVEMAQSQDRTPEYLQAFDSQASQAGWDKSQLATQLHALREQPLLVAGWSLHDIECNLLPQSQPARAQCRYQWKRVGGTAADFERSLDPNHMRIDWNNASVNTLYTLQERPAAHHPVRREQLRTLHEARKAHLTLAQFLSNVNDVDIKFADPAEWSGKDTTGVLPDARILQIPFTMGGPIHQAKGLLEHSLDDLYIKSFTVQTENLKIQFKGVAYAR